MSGSKITYYSTCIFQTENNTWKWYVRTFIEKTNKWNIIRGKDEFDSLFNANINLINFVNTLKMQ